MKKGFFWIVSSAAVALSMAGQGVWADGIAPADAVGTEGATSGGFGSNFQLVSQELYVSADISGLHVGDQIGGIQLRLDGGQSAFPSSTAVWSEFNISLGVGQSSLGSTFASNFVGSPTLVRSGSLTMAPGFFPGTGSPRDWSQEITFSTPYTYTGGNLLLEVRTNSPAASLTVDTMTGSQTDGQSIFNTSGNVNATTADAGPFGDNWPITFDTVPEPASLSIVALGGMMMLRRRRK